MGALFQCNMRSPMSLFRFVGKQTSRGRPGVVPESVAMRIKRCIEKFRFAVAVRPARRAPVGPESDNLFAKNLRRRRQQGG